MGYVKPQQIDTLTLPSDPSFYVKMKRRFDWGDRGKVTDALLTVDLSAVTPSTPAPKLDSVTISAGSRALVLALITEWNLTGEDDAILPLTMESLALLDPADGEYLLTEASKRSNSVPLVTGEASTPQSSPPSTDTPSNGNTPNA